MFGLWFSKRLYENLPAAWFLSGFLIVCLSFFLDGSAATQWLALSGLALMGAAFFAVAARSRNRDEAFKLRQLFTFRKVEEETFEDVESG